VDGPHFDAIARLFARRTSRRRVLAGLVALWFDHGSGSAKAATATPTPTATPADAVPPGSYPTPLSDPFGACPASGEGGDPDLNTLKNRDDLPADGGWVPVWLDAILALPVPPETTRQMRNWPEASREEVFRYAGAPVRTEGFLIEVSRSSGESCNCNRDEYGDPDEVDFHVVLALAGDTFDRAVVTEVTPRIRAGHPGWTLAALRDQLAGETPVRLSGWLMLDTEHQPDVEDGARGTRWEIHPIMEIEVLRNGEWTPLDIAVPTSTPDAAAEPTAEPGQTPAAEADMDCADFATQAEAQRFFLAHGGPDQDPHGLDRDGNGIACESLP
jgi:hypothetical protein